MADSGIVQIQLLGTSFSIRSDQDPAYVRKLVQYIKDKTETVKGSANDPLRVSIMSSLLIADELFRERMNPGASPEGPEASEEASRLTAEIIARLEESLQE